MENTIFNIPDFQSPRNVPVLWHKKSHGSEGACVRGLYHGCPQPENCPDDHQDNSGSYCLRDGQINGGYLIRETKHNKHVEDGHPAYLSIEDAMTSRQVVNSIRNLSVLPKAA